MTSKKYLTHIFLQRRPHERLLVSERRMSRLRSTAVESRGQIEVARGVGRSASSPSKAFLLTENIFPQTALGIRNSPRSVDHLPEAPLRASSLLPFNSVWLAESPATQGDLCIVLISRYARVPSGSMAVLASTIKELAPHPYALATRLVI